MDPKFQVQLKIRKPVAEVFEAVVKPDKLSGYFVQNASGPLVEGTTVKWKFAEAKQPFDIIARHVIKNERIVFEWPTNEGGYNTRVEMAFKALDDGSTLVQIAESGWRPTPEGIKSSYDNAGGWMHMLCSMKAYLEYGINLRAGGTGHGCG
jgi:uncharacterized protein YndB with AHSA1/START domain